MIFNSLVDAKGYFLEMACMWATNILRTIEAGEVPLPVLIDRMNYHYDAYMKICANEQ